ncbi:MAG TPA: methyltransferase domain-containing protein [Alphaproteobacteria bacterium]
MGLRVKEIVKPLVPQRVLALREILASTKPLHERTCPICDYHGYFSAFGRPPRLDAKCPKCGSLERDRLFWLSAKRRQLAIEEPILHFAPEPILEDRFRRTYQDYATADLYADADLNLDIENIDLQTGAIRTVICNHVLEHVCDRRALAELNRILSDDGRLICSVPIVEGWERTYESESVTEPNERALHFGQRDHLRFYGRDFRDRLRAAGFAKLQEVTAEGRDVVDHSLRRGEKLFVCMKR